MPPVGAAAAQTPAPTLPEVQSSEAGRADVRAEELRSIILWSHQTPDTRGGDGSHGSGRDQDMLPLHVPGVPLQCDPPDKLHHPVDPLQYPVQSGQYHHLASIRKHN